MNGCYGGRNVEKGIVCCRTSGGPDDVDKKVVVTGCSIRKSVDAAVGDIGRLKMMKKKEKTQPREWLQIEER